MSLDGLSVVVAAGETIAHGQACAFTGNGEEIRLAGAGDEDVFAGIAAYGGDAGDLILLHTMGTRDFEAGQLFTSVNAGAALKLAANGQLVLAAAAEKYVARYHHRDIWGGQGGDMALGTGSDVTQGNYGRALLEKGVA